MQQFSTQLRLGNGSLVDELEEPDQRLYFIDKDLLTAFEREASDQFFGLIQPLFQGGCLEFLKGSMDPQANLAASVTETCMVLRRFADLLGEVVAAEPVQSIPFDQASLLRHPGRERLSVGGGADSLVEQLVTFKGQEQKIFISAIMRRQSSGEWRILHLMP